MKCVLATLVFLLSLSLANPQQMAAFITPEGNGAVALLFDDGAGVLLEDHPYSLVIHFSSLGPVTMDLPTLASIVDLVVGWADGRGLEGCGVRVLVSIAADGTVDQVSAVDCGGQAVALWFLFRLPPQDRVGSST
jgi:hypothetical protein